LVTDMVMPGLSGRDLSERLRALRPSLRVLYISGYVQDASARAALASERSAFVAKPFSPELLTDRVRELLATADAEATYRCRVTRRGRRPLIAARPSP